MLTVESDLKFKSYLESPPGQPKEWVQRLVAAKKNHENKEHQAAKMRAEKQRAATTSLYNELLRNRMNLQNEVSDAKRMLEMDWTLRERRGSPERQQQQKPKGWQKPKENKLKIEFPKWKETPKGLSLWLEGVVAKAKEEEERKQQQLKEQSQAFAIGNQYHNKPPPPKLIH